MKITAEEIVARIEKQIEIAREDGKKYLISKEKAQADGNESKVEFYNEQMQEMLNEIHTLEVLLMGIRNDEMMKN